MNILFVHRVADRSEASLVTWMSGIGDQVTDVANDGVDGRAIRGVLLQPYRALTQYHSPTLAAVEQGGRPFVGPEVIVVPFGAVNEWADG